MECNKHCIGCSTCSEEQRKQTDTVLKDMVERTGSTKKVTNAILNMHVTTINEKNHKCEREGGAYRRI